MVMGCARRRRTLGRRLYRRSVHSVSFEDLWHVHDDCTGPTARTSVWRNHAARRVVDPAGRCRSGSIDVPRLLDVGGVPERTLYVRPVPLAVLLSGNFRLLSAQLVRTTA